MSIQNTVEPVQIEKELTRIWREAAKADAATEGAANDMTARIKSTLSNLIILVRGDTPSRYQLDNLVTELVITHPSRFFVVRFDDSAEAKPLEASVSSRCVLANSGKHVCSEEIHLTVRPDGVQHVPNLLLSLFVADVEVVIIFPNTAAEEAVSENPFGKLVCGIESLCDRVIYDSAMFCHYQKEMAPLLSLSQETMAAVPHEVKLRDLNWSRIERWRMLIAEQFSAQRFQDASANLTRIELSCEMKAGQKTLPADALLLSGWILWCLGWEPKMLLPKNFVPGEANKLRWAVGCLGKAGQSCAIEFIANAASKNDSAQSSVLSNVTLSLTEGDTASVISICRDVAQQTAEASTLTFNPAEKNSETKSIPRRSQFPIRTVEELLLSNVVTSSGKEDYQRALERSLLVANMLLSS